MSLPHVLLLYNEPVLSADHPDAISEREVLESAEVVCAGLQAAGFKVTRFGLGREPGALLAGLRRHRPDVVFNLFEGLADLPNTEASLAGLLEWLRIPFTGCPSQTLALARQKHLTKVLFEGAGLPTPEFFLVEHLPVPPCPLDWPVIVKPAAEDGSSGIDQGSIVTDQDSLNNRVAYVLENYGGPVLVEEFIDGREFVIHIAATPEPRPLPHCEILFHEQGQGKWPIYCRERKWVTELYGTGSVAFRFGMDLPPRLARRLGALAVRAFRLLGCRDYASVDIRITPTGKPYLLELNPNPDLAPRSYMAHTIEASGITYSRFLADVVWNALARSRTPVAGFVGKEDGEVQEPRRRRLAREPVRQMVEQ